MSVFRISEEKKVVLDQGKETSKDSGIGRKKPVTGNVTGTLSYVLNCVLPPLNSYVEVLPTPTPRTSECDCV